MGRKRSAKRPTHFATLFMQQARKCDVPICALSLTGSDLLLFRVLYLFCTRIYACYARFIRSTTTHSVSALVFRYLVNSFV